MKILFFLLIFCTTAFATEPQYKVFRFENYLSWKGKFNQKQAEEDFARFYPKGTDMVVVNKAIVQNNEDAWCEKESRDGEVVCSKYLRSLRGLFTKTDYMYIYIYTDKNKKLLDFKIYHYNNSFII